MFSFATTVLVTANDWADWRGPARDGISTEKHLQRSGLRPATTYSGKLLMEDGSAPIVMGDHVYVQNSSGKGADIQERVMCFKC